MFSLHIDTARTWRGGQNQVLLTVQGLAEAGHDAILLAHEHGELKRRVYEQHPDDIESYCDGKDEWIKQREPIAIAWFRESSR